jgi:hypothetical protein
MIKSKKEKDSKIYIDLSGPEGNAFVLLGIASKLAKKLGYSKEQTDTVLKEMKSSNYEHLVHVLDSEFGEHLVIYQ